MDDEVKAYFEAVPEQRKKKLQSLHALVMQLFPDAVVDMRYKMPTYSHERGWLALANQKNYVSLYTCSAEHLAEFKQSNPEIKTGKGCINLSDRDPIPEAAIEQVIRHAMLEPK